MEDSKRNFILLSKVAREKKYAQEYLGLLARRGDIGSIRIGKRWYTTEEWFSEFLKDAEARKAEMKAAQEPLKAVGMQIAEAKKEEEKTEKILFPEKIEVKKEIRAEKIFEEKNKKPEKELAAEGIRINFRRESSEIGIRREIGKPAGNERTFSFQEKSRVPFLAQRKLETIDLRKISARKKVLEKVPAKGADEREKKIPIKTPEISKWEKVSGNISPDFAELTEAPFVFPKFAFSMAMVLLLVLLFEFGWVFQDKVKNFAGSRSGIVAGAKDSNLVAKSVLASAGEYLEEKKDGVKENISLSRVLLKAAIEKDNEQGTENPEEEQARDGAGNEQ